MAKAKRSGASHKSYYTRYKNSNVHDVNARRRIERAIKKYPENEVLQTHLKSVSRARKTPATRMWSKTARRIAELYSLFVGRFDKDIISTNEKLAGEKRMITGPTTVEKPKTQAASSYGMFSLGARARIVGSGRWNF